MKSNASEIPPRWAWHYRALLRLGTEMAGGVGDRVEAVRAGVAHGGTDRGEVATDETEHEALVAEIRQERTELAEIGAALVRMRLGTYGICELTGARIEPERLRALPWARYAVAAAARRERAAETAPPRG